MSSIFLEHPVGDGVAGVQLESGEDSLMGCRCRDGGSDKGSSGIGSGNQGASSPVETEGGSGGWEVCSGCAESQVVGYVVDTLGCSESIDVAV